MIRNLNAITFRNFGAVHSERPQNTRNLEKEVGTLLALDGKNAMIYRSRSQTHISCGTAMIVLSVSMDGESYWHFCLDKSIDLKPGIYYTMTPFEGQAEVRVSAEEAPEYVDQMSAERLRSEQLFAADRKLRIGGIQPSSIRRRSRASCSPAKLIPSWSLPMWIRVPCIPWWKARICC